MTAPDEIGPGGDATRPRAATPVLDPQMTEIPASTRGLDPEGRGEPGGRAESTRGGDGDDGTSEPRIPTTSWTRLVTGLSLLAVVGVAVLLRVWALDRFGFNSDETVYAGQAAVLAGNKVLAPFFPAFRAHPLLFQTLLSLPYHAGVDDLVGRLLVVAFGVGTVIVVYLVGRSLYGRLAGLAAAAILAVMPYHVTVSRQVLLDAPMVFFATLSLWFLARYGERQRRADLYAASVALGMTFLTKETGIVLGIAVYAFFALTPQVRTRFRDVIGAGALLGVMLIAYPASLTLAGRTKTGQQYLAWQILRRPNHTFAFYFEQLPNAIGIAVLVVVLWGLWYLRRERTWREALLLAWILVPLAFFELWPVKGYQYLLPIAPPVAVLAGRGLARLPGATRGIARRMRIPAGVIPGVVAVVVGASLIVPSWNAITSSGSGSFLAGTGGLPGGREAGHWVGEHIPEGSTLLALGPSMANVIQFYGHRKVYGLSVSSNPLHRNPVYQPVGNPDRLMRDGDLQYVVWDSYSAARSPTFSHRLLAYATKYHGRIVYSGGGYVHGSSGPKRIVVYEVRP